MRFGLVSLPVTGHLNPMTALARKLQPRGNEVVFFGAPDVRPIVRPANLDFVPFREKEYPVGPMTRPTAVISLLRRGWSFVASGICKGPSYWRSPTLTARVWQRLTTTTTA